MANPKLSTELAQEALDARASHSTGVQAARSLNLDGSTFRHRVATAERLGLTPTVAIVQPPPPPERIPYVPPAPPRGELTESVARLLRYGEKTFVELAGLLAVTPGAIIDSVEQLKRSGVNIFRRGEGGEVVSIEKTPIQLAHSDELHTFESDDDGVYRFGFVTDNHLGSKYAREDVLNDLYDLFAAEGITRVYNGGNWIDGEARFNRQDIKVHGMQAQVDYFVANYPQRPGIKTLYVAGDDHEGWYAQREGIDIGRYAELCAQKAGRFDLQYMGYMEAWIALTHKRTRATSQMLIVHPGGGSSYAISYAPQKFVEALQGGEKPAVVCFGHWHKMDCFNYRNVWICQGGTTEDQTPFMRKRKLEAHVGGMLIELRQDERGAITDCIPRMRRYFDRGYYNDQFNPAGPLGPRKAA